MRRDGDLWAGLAVAFLGAALLALTFRIRLTEAGLVGPRFVPQVVAGLLVAGGLALALRPRSGGAAVPEDVPADDAAPAPLSPPGEEGPPAGSATGDGAPTSPLPALALPVMGLLYVAAIPWVGYLAATLPAAAAALWLFGARRPVFALLAALGLTAAMQAVFVELMGVFLPRGRLLDLAAWLG